MKVEIKEEVVVEFTPIELNITIESKEELTSLLSRLALSNTAINSLSEDFMSTVEFGDLYYKLSDKFKQ